VREKRVRKYRAMDGEKERRRFAGMRGCKERTRGKIRRTMELVNEQRLILFAGLYLWRSWSYGVLWEGMGKVVPLDFQKLSMSRMFRSCT